MTSQPSRSRDFQALEERRLRAARWLGEGKSQAEVARLLEVSRQSVSRWHRVWQEQGEAGLRAAGRAGRKPRLSPDDLGRLEQALLQGPKAHGYATELWTLSRIARLIAGLTGVRYHISGVWRVLRRLGWSTQRPARQAKERDEKAIARWRKRRWPQRKRGR